MMIETSIKRIIAIGASAGGFEAVAKVLQILPQDLQAAIFIVIHTGRDASSQIILNTIQKSTKLTCKIAVDGDLIENCMVYVAPADHHLMVYKKYMLVKNGATENNWRPSIDVLFRSAAAHYNSCVIGIVLSGLLNDGTSGMSAIKRCGGICIVQDPGEAQFCDMPKNVINHVSIHHQVAADEIGYILIDLLSSDIPCVPKESPSEVKLEAEINRRMSSNLNELDQLGDKTSLTCPDCGRILLKYGDSEASPYKCLTGHVYSSNLLEKFHAKNVENSIWVAIRMMEERKNLMYNTINNVTDQKDNLAVIKNTDRVKFLSEHIAVLKKLLNDISEIDDESVVIPSP